MTVERLSWAKKRSVLVGIRLDGQAKELLDWAVVKVADPGDSVVAIHVCRHYGCQSKERTVINGYLEDYEGLCSEKQVALTAEILRGKSIRKALVREAKKGNASAVIVGITKHSALGGWLSVAKYCAKRLPLTVEVMAVYNGKIVFSRLSKIQSEGYALDPKPSIYINDNHPWKDNYSEFGESEVSEVSMFSFDGRDGTISPTVRRYRRGSLSSISLPPEDFTKQRPGWPLLQTSSLVSRPSLEARKKSVVQWVMSLPRRSLSEISEDSFDRENGISEELKLARLPKDLEAILRSCSSSAFEVFSLDVLRKSTSEFSSANLIGKGGSNSVYKGILRPGRAVAVKILESSKESNRQFIQEVEIMTTLKHKRVAPLLGICVEDGNLMSVYDYISKGNLEDNLHCGTKGEDSVLKWEARFRIAIGIAEALNYLHNESPRPVIHRDVKSSNILLTNELEPKLSDFGLAIWAPGKSPFLTDNDVVGTFGYLAPEYFMYGKVSDKIDVYAFGVVLLELLSGKMPIGLESNKGQKESLVMWAKPKLQSGDWKSILDPNLNEDIDEDQMHRMAKASALCLTQAARLRPKISQVLSILIRGEECVDASEGNSVDSNNAAADYDDDDDDEVYPNSSAESHLSLAFLDVNDNSASSFRL